MSAQREPVVDDFDAPLDPAIADAVRDELMRRCHGELLEPFTDYASDFDASPFEWVRMLERTDDRIWTDAVAEYRSILQGRNQ